MTLTQLARRRNGKGPIRPVNNVTIAAPDRLRIGFTQLPEELSQFRLDYAC